MRVHLSSCADGAAFVRFARIVDYAEHPSTLRCSGDEDRSTQARRRTALTRAIKARSDLVIELSELTWADASLMLDFVMLARRLRAEERLIVLRRPQPQIVALIELVGLDRLPGVCVERAQAAAPAASTPSIARLRLATA
ncbi:MAG TPA: STAS domain-containing protein [Conexibacter sp.]